MNRRSPMVLVRVALLAAAAACAASPHAAPMGADDARHLLARTGFGPTESEIRAFAPLSRNDAVERLLADVQSTPMTPPPAWASETGPLRPVPAATATPDERKAFLREQVRRGLELRAWWIEEMLVTPSPLTERMTLFWHNHFVSGQQKVRVARLMYAQNAAFRENAVGSFATLLHVASKDPAMLVYLDGVQNRKGAPNENFAREVMELFTLGVGRYDERDVKEAARAFTGWSIERETGGFVFRPRLHDDGVKTVLGRTGAFDGDAVLDVILARPETAEFVVGKLWKEFVSATPDPSEVSRIAQAFRASRYDVKVALRELLRTPAFWAPAQRGTLVKSPVDVVVGTLRQLELTPPDARAFALVAAGMGQNLFAPPNVRGWPGGDAWINSNTLLARKDYLDRVARQDAAPPPLAPTAMQTGGAPSGAAAAAARVVDRGLRSVRFDAAAWLAQRDGATRDARIDAARRLLLPIAPTRTLQDDADARAAVYALLLDPAYQLK